MLADRQRTPEEIAILRRMTPEQKWNIAKEMYWMGRRGKKAALLSEHPDWSEKRAEEEIKGLLLSDRTDLFEPFAPTLEEFLQPYIDGTKIL